MTTDRSCLCVVLAAGEGTRMKSALPKVLHPIGGLPMVGHVINAAKQVGSEIAAVTGSGGDEVDAAIEKLAPQTEYFRQQDRLGTGHAVLTARAAIERGYDDILVVFGDAPLVDPSVLRSARGGLAAGADVVVVGFRTPEPTGYGRLIETDGRLAAIREECDCSDEEKLITYCNGGLMAISGERAIELLDQIGNDNAKREYYLTDIVEIANGDGLVVVAVEAPFESVLGINNKAELAAAEHIWQQRRRRAAMLSGVTLLAPETVFFSHDTEIGADTVVEQNVVFGPHVRIAAGVTIRAFSHIAGATIAEGAEVGPFARLRPGAKLGEASKVGNFCEVKNADVASGAKINHLTYVGDAVVGARANLGAGTITCNYDGFSKHLTQIGAGAFIGSNSSLVAPVKIGADAYVASGSVITSNVPDDALAIGRSRQENKEGRAEMLRRRHSSQKAGTK
ncbi:MAG: bifunctional UDP-N-acetylglucosamine diphosphorylase/glucosamine-1-phosphate N-acetyltransferase GlmU [Rhizobiaceae bacterium]|nr:bifunctional UDP-N-acetylglucosamine diphosphorylase/glucosamine-1-phosphate N-acetyltransferase GlmU [Rhizobiaceae bacterium]